MTGCSGPEAPPPDSGAALDAFVAWDASTDARSLPDAPLDAFYPPPDAFRVPAEVRYRNPTPPDCLDRTMPPRWTAPRVDAAPGTVLWSVSIASDPRLEAWRRSSDFVRLSPIADYPPSLTGRGVATWFFRLPAMGDSGDSQWGAGFALPDGAFVNSGRFALYDPPWTWNARTNGLVNTRWAVPIANPVPTDGSGAVAVAPEPLFEGGPSIGYPEDDDMPAWSPLTGDYIGFAQGEVAGVAAYCTEGVRWFTQLPIYRGNSVAYVKTDGNVIVANRRELWVLDGQTGEPLSHHTYATPFQVVSGYQPGCGILLSDPVAATWRWLDEESFEEGPTLRYAGRTIPGVSIGTAGSVGTTDCGVVTYTTDPEFTTYLTRLNADGSTRYNVFQRGPVGFETGARPIMLADQGTLVLWQPFELRHYDAMGNEVARYAIDQDRAGRGAVTPPAMGPDGTLFVLSDGPVGPSFVAIATGLTPGPLLWPNSGLNWARTNSVLPE
jgi:hypothetical protein